MLLPLATTIQNSFSNCNTNLGVMDLSSLTKETVRTNASAWAIPTGCQVKCSDGTIIIGIEDEVEEPTTGDEPSNPETPT